MRHDFHLEAHAAHLAGCFEHRFVAVESSEDGLRISNFDSEVTIPLALALDVCKAMLHEYMQQQKERLLSGIE